MFREQTRVNRDPPEEWYREIPLDRDTARFLYWGLAERTRSNYSTARKSYILLCGIHGISAFPVTIRSLSSWITKMGLRRLSHKSIKLYMTGLRSYHVELGASKQELEIFHTPVLQRVIAGIRRFNGEPDVKERHPITRPVLRAMLARLDKNTRKGANLYAAFCLAFAGFLRMGEFTWARGELNPDFRNWHITRGSVLLSDDRLQLSLPASKTDPFRQGITHTIAATGDEACAVAALKYLFARFPTPLNSPLFDTGHGFSRQFVTEALRNILKELGFTGNYSGHSFRRGAATSAREAGLSDAEIQLLGRWKSDAYKLYIQANPAVIWVVSKRHQDERSARE